MAQQTALDEIILAINEQMDILEMDYNNDVVWSMLVMHNCLKGLLFKCNQAKAMEKEQILKAYNESFRLRYYPYETADVYFDKMYNKEK